MTTRFHGLPGFIKWFTVVLFAQCLLIQGVNAQCGTVISTFPYTENFESGPAWTSGGTNSDWAWGTPAHPTISSAGGGTKSWCVGGLTGSSYNGSEDAWLMSPCFDFSGLNYPWISFKIFWENEFKFDGTTFQYSIDGGTTWHNVGAYGDAVNCLNDNWFNYNNITWLSTGVSKHGWTGRIGLTSGSCQGGNGSGGWVTAKHCMSSLANKPNVRFRFLFGSGTTCNAYDGIAIDDILIQEATPNTAGFTWNCTGASSVSFTNTSSSCSTGYSWNFGDPASGASNTSSSANPSHTFSAAGAYTVTLTANGPCNAPGVFTQTVTILSASVSSTDVSCSGGNNGTATANASGGSALSYAWSTTPVQTTQTATGLAAGVYTVNVTDPVACPATASVTIIEPSPIVLSFTSSPSCTDVCNGSVGVTATGGTPPYTYAWASLGTSQDYTGTVCIGTYTATVTDANGCVNMNTATVDAYQTPVIEVAPAGICVGSSAVLTATGANAYSWWPSTGLSDTTGASVIASPSSTITYSVSGTSADGCTGSTTVTVTVNPVEAPVAAFAFTPQQPDVFHPEVNFINLTNGTNTYVWNFYGMDESSEINPVHSFPTDSAGTYTVCLMAQNSIGCTDEICHGVTVTGFTSIYAPNAFTPDGDGVNEIFMPILRDISRQDFNFTVFNRWGEIVFSTNNLSTGWDGTRKGISSEEGVYVWKIKYIEPTTKTGREVSGHVTLLR